MLSSHTATHCTTHTRNARTHMHTNQTQVSTALKLSEEDQATIAALKREIEKSWKVVDAAHEKVGGLHCVCACVLCVIRGCDCVRKRLKSPGRSSTPPMTRCESGYVAWATQYAPQQEAF